MFVDICKYKRGEKTYTRSLLRAAYREKGKVRHRTIANLSHFPMEQILKLKAALKGKTIPAHKVLDPKTMPLKQGASCGALFVLLNLARQLGITSVLGSSKSALMILWLVFARLIDQGSRLSVSRLAKPPAWGYTG